MQGVEKAVTIKDLSLANPHDLVAIMELTSAVRPGTEESYARGALDYLETVLRWETKQSVLERRKSLDRSG